MDLSRNNNDNNNDTMNATPPPWFSSADVATLRTAVALAVVRQRRRRGLPQQPSSDTVMAPEEPIVLLPSSHQQQVVVQQHLDAMMATAVRLVQSKKNHNHPHHIPVLPTGLVAHLRHIWRHASVAHTHHLWLEHPWPALSHVWQEILCLPQDDNAALPAHVLAQLRTDLGQLITTQALWQVWRDTTTTTSSNSNSNSSTTSHNTSATLDDLLPLVELLHQCGGGMPDAHGVYPADLYTLYHQAPPATTPTAMVDALWLRYAVGRS